MTAEYEHSLNNNTSNAFQNQVANVDNEEFNWAKDEVIKEEMPKEVTSKKRRRQLTEEDYQHLSPPLEKSPRRNDIQVSVEEQVELRLIDEVQFKQKDALLAYKRIWNSLDLSKPADAKLEPFIWHKIREHQKNK